MHILKIIHGFPPKYNAGSEVYTQSLVNELKNFHKVTVFTREENDYLPDFNFRKVTNEQIDFVFANMPRAKDGYNHELFNQHFSQFIAKVKPDVAHIGHLNHLSLGIVDVLKRYKIPIVFTLHDFWLMCPRGQFLQRNFDGEKLFELCEKQENVKCAQNCYSMYFSNYKLSSIDALKYELPHSSPRIGKDTLNDLEHWTNWIEARMDNAREIADKIDVFFAPSQYLKKRFINDFSLPEEKIIYLDYGFPTHYLQPVIPQNNNIYTFGYIGTHIPAKGINLLIDAFKLLNGKAKLKIYGREQGQNTMALKELCENSANQIEFCGEYVNENLATTVFNKVDCIVVPSIWAENSPLVIHEAQACKVPVITANFGGMAEYVHHKVNGLLFEHRNFKSLAEQMQWTLENQTAMKKLGESGYLFSENGEIPDIKKHVQKLISIYESLKFCF